MVFNRNPPPLEERIEKLRAEIDAIIDAKAEAEAKNCPGIPLGVIRSLLTAKGRGCQCAQYLEVKKADDETAARGVAA